jgi:hypothetical protein
MSKKGKPVDRSQGSNKGLPEEEAGEDVEIDAGLTPAIRLWLKTLGYALPSFLYLTLLSLGSIAIISATFGLCAVAFTYVHKYVAIGLTVLGILPLVFLWMPFASRKMFNITTGHVGVFTELILTGGIDRGEMGLFKYGRAMIAGTFGEREVFHSFHSQINQMLSHLVRTLDRLDDKVPELAFAKKYLMMLRNLIVRHIEFVVISYTLAQGVESEEELEERSLEGTCYVVQNGLGLLKTAVAGAILERITASVMWFLLGLGLTAGIFFWGYSYIFELPIPDFSAFDMNLLSEIGLWISFFAAIVIGPLLGYLATWGFMEFFMRPVTTAMVLLKFHKLTQNQPLKAEWADRIRDGAFAMDRLDWLSFRTLGIGH